ncbi:MAG: alpha/beta fold hydrolase [Thermoleophilaceae bacterium]|nr:alpha/beta fold hydrolase [Thermoleophilaceae bacterium]
MPPIVYVPGFMQRAATWGPVADRLAERYPPIFVEHVSYEREVRLGEIEATAPGGAVLCGYSLGGRLALHTALREPARYGGLVMVGAGAGLEDPAMRRKRRARDERLARWIEKGPIEEVVEHWEGREVFASQSPELVAAQRAGRLTHDPVSLAVLLRSAGQGTIEPVWSRLAELSIPVLAVAGQDDHAYSVAAHRLAAEAPHGSVALVPGAGHAAHLEAPEAVADRVAEFADRLP